MVNIITAVLVIVSVKVTAIRNLQLLTSQAIHLLPALDIATLTIDNTGIYLSTHDAHVNPQLRPIMMTSLFPPPPLSSREPFEA